MESCIEGREHIQCLHHVCGWCHQICNTVMIFIVFLTEPASWHGHYSRLIDHVHAVHKIYGTVLFCGPTPSFLTEVDSREAIHGPFDVIARNAVHFIALGS